MKLRVGRGKGFRAFATMSDISFLLLIFLVICSAMNEAADVEVPRFPDTRKTGFENSVSIVLKEGGSCDVDGVAARADDLAGVLAPYAGRPVVVKVFAGRDEPYADVARLLSALGTMDVRNVQLIAERDEEAR